MSPADLRRLFARLATAEAITSGPFPGLTPGRLQTLLEAGQRPLARLLLVWFDHAGLLEAPATAAEPYRHPRTLRTSDLAWIAAQLLGTPVPTEAEVAGAMGGRAT